MGSLVLGALRWWAEEVGNDRPLPLADYILDCRKVTNVGQKLAEKTFRPKICIANLTLINSTSTLSFTYPIIIFAGDVGTLLN